MVRRRKPPSQTWRTFLENHFTDLVSLDFFTVPIIRFQILRLDAEGHVPEESLALFDQAIHSAAAQLKALGDMEEFTEKRMEIGMGLDCP